MNSFHSSSSSFRYSPYFYHFSIGGSISTSKPAKSLKLVKIAIIGEPAVGKSTTISQILEGRARREYKPTMGVNIHTAEIKQGKHIHQITIWDLAGQSGFDLLSTLLIKDASYIIAMYDLSRPSTLWSLKKWFQRITTVATDDISCIVVGNKSDLVRMEPAHVEYISTTLNPLIPVTAIWEISALNKTNLFEMWHDLLSKIERLLSSLFSD